MVITSQKIKKVLKLFFFDLELLLLNLEIVNALERIEGEEQIPDTRKMV